MPRGALPGVLRRVPAVDRRAVARAVGRAVDRLLEERVFTLFLERASLFTRLRSPHLRRVVEIHAPLSWEAVLWEGLSPSPRLVDAERESLLSAETVWVQNPAMQRWCEWLGVPPSRIRLRLQAAHPAPPHQAPDDGPFVLGCAATWKTWHVGSRVRAELAGLVDQIRPRPLHLELFGCGPGLPDVVAAAADLGVPCRALGWADRDTVATARARWHAAWVPRAPWPPLPPAGTTLSALEHRLSAPFPDRWFEELKVAEAGATGVPIWIDGTLRPSTIPPTWDGVATAILEHEGAAPYIVPGSSVPSRRVQ